MENPDPDEGVLVKSSGVRLFSPKNLNPPTRILNDGTFPLGDFGEWQHKHVPIFGVSCKSGLEFYAQLNIDETNKVLDCITAYIGSKSVEDLETLCKSVPKNPKSNTDCSDGFPCLALFPGDNDWYRARIIKDLDADMHEVLFVDYGNMETLPSKSLIPCPDYLCEYIEGASCCAIAGFTGDENSAEIKALKKVVTEKDLIGRIDSLSADTNAKCGSKMFLSVYDLHGVPIKNRVDAILRKRQSKTESKEKSSSAPPTTVGGLTLTSTTTTSTTSTVTRKLFVKPSSPELKQLAKSEVKQEGNQPLSPGLEDLPLTCEIPELVARHAIEAIAIPEPAEKTCDNHSTASTVTILIAPRTSTIPLDQPILMSDESSSEIKLSNASPEELKEKLTATEALMREKEYAWKLEKDLLEEQWNLRLVENDKYFHQIMHEKTRVMDHLQKELVKVKSDAIKIDHRMRSHVMCLESGHAIKEEALRGEIQGLKNQLKEEVSSKTKSQGLMELLKFQIKELTELNSNLRLKEEEAKSELTMKTEEHKKGEASIKKEWLKKFEESEVELHKIFDPQLKQLCDDKMAAERKLEVTINEKDEEIHKLKSQLEEHLQLGAEAQKANLVLESEVGGEGLKNKTSASLVDVATTVFTLNSQAKYESQTEEPNSSEDGMIALSEAFTALLISSKKEKKRLENIIQAKNLEIAALTKMVPSPLQK